MQFNESRAPASEVYLVQKWDTRRGTPAERRSRIFQEFVKLGMRKRWEWHKVAENYVFSEEEKAVSLCRTWTARSIASWICGDLRRVMMTDRVLDMSTEELEYRVEGKGGNNPSLVCEYEGNPFDVLPELVYSMTAYDDTADMAEARAVHDQSLWVTGVFWLVDKIVWVDEFGRTIREKVCDARGLEEAAEALERYNPFESTWWTEATNIGKYAEDECWR